MAEYIDREEFLKRIKPYDTPDKTDKALYNFALNKMIGTPTADVVEREKINQAIEEIENQKKIIFERDGESDLGVAIRIIKKYLGEVEE